MGTVEIVSAGERENATVENLNKISRLNNQIKNSFCGDSAIGLIRERQKLERERKKILYG